MEDTIVGISTALGVGAISIVRLSGHDAIPITKKLFKGKDLDKVKTHTINYGHIVENSEIIDEVLVSIMRGPNTYTREDVVEINCHGGINTTNKVLELAILNGARLAENGEFTRRAFLNGRIDLTESEAVMDLIESTGDVERRLAISNLEGNLSKMIKNERNILKDLISHIEVNIDYPEYYDIEVVDDKLLKTTLQEEIKKLEELIKESNDKEIIKTGINTVIVGRPNVGKSSLLNALLNKEKAIVTDIAGTTRDIVEGNIFIDNIKLNITDTAGIRETENIVEKIGVEKSLSLINNADLILVVLNQNELLTKEDIEILEKTKDKTSIVILNKNDLEKKIDSELLIGRNIVSTNTTELNGIKPLKDKIKEMFNLDKIKEINKPYLTNTRQLTLAKIALKSLVSALKSVEENVPIDMVEIDIKNAFDSLGEIIGQTYSDEILDNLFKNFCVGK